MTEYKNISGEKAYKLLETDEEFDKKTMFIIVLRALQRKTFIEYMLKLYDIRLGDSKLSFVKKRENMQYIKSNLTKVLKYLEKYKNKQNAKVYPIVKPKTKQDIPIHSIPKELLNIINNHSNLSNLYKRAQSLHKIITDLLKIHKEYYTLQKTIQSYDDQPGAGVMEILHELQEEMKNYKLKSIRNDSKAASSMKIIGMSSLYKNVSLKSPNSLLPLMDHIDIIKKYVKRDDNTNTYYLDPRFEINGIKYKIYTDDNTQQEILKIIYNSDDKYIPGSPLLMSYIST